MQQYYFNIPQRYHRTSNQDRERVVEYCENVEDFVTFANNLGVRRLTACSIVRLYQQQGRIASGQINFLAPKDAQCSRNYAKPIFQLFLILWFNKNIHFKRLGHRFFDQK